MRAASASIACEAPYSCMKESTQLARMIAPMMTASLPSPTKPETIAAKIRIRTSGLRNWRRKALATDAPLVRPMAFGPHSPSRACASAVDSPPALACSRASRSSAGTDQ